VTILEKGHDGPDVTRLQRLLNSLLKPSPHLREDGDFGDKTRTAVIRFQTLRGLKPDGVVGPQTWTALGQKMAGKKAPASAKVTGANWMSIARGELELQVRTLPGQEHDPRILEYFDTTTYQPGDDETAWCSAFVNWVLKKAGKKGTRSAAAKSWLDWGTTLAAPREGAVTVIYYKAKDKKIDGCKPMTTGSGNHVGFFVSASATHIRLLGGNQGKKVSEIGFPLSCWEVKGYRWP
jgi:uncharacterized protein (TIGR02594 family)